MRIDDVLQFFGNAAKACDAINTSHSNLSKWKKQNKGIVPAQHAVSFVIASNGGLLLGFEDYPLNRAQEQHTQQAA